jgi:dinuclear metal center YbgI/SA1388 family protein
MKISEVVSCLESFAPPSLQEHYDNAGLLLGNKDWECSGIICCLDVSEEVIREAIAKKCNLVVAHHPLIFGNLKKITGKNHVEKTVIGAIKNDVAVYAAHTNLDNIIGGVNGKIAGMLGLQNILILLPKESTLKKLYTYVPTASVGQVRDAIFEAGGGYIGNYSDCSFSAAGTGTFKAGDGSHPYIGRIGERHEESELKLEIIFPGWLEQKILKALKDSHPYEEVAYEVIELSNTHQGIGSGLIGELPAEINEMDFLADLKKIFNLQVIRHTSLIGKPVKKVGLCGGAGSFLVNVAAASGADVFVTGDMKYHEFFDANGEILVADIGHYESEQFTIDLLADILVQKFPNFAVLKTKVQTNPVRYYTGG